MNEEVGQVDVTDNQIDNKPWLWKKGQSGNLMGRPKGKTMKEYARQYLERMTDEERDKWLEGIPKEKIWEMGEGKAKQDVDLQANVNIASILDDLDGPKISRQTVESQPLIQNTGQAEELNPVQEEQSATALQPEQVVEKYNTQE